MRKLWRILRWGIAVVVLLIGLLLALVHTPPVRRYALSRIIQAAGPGVALDANSLDYNLLAGWVELTGVRMGAGPDPFLTATRIRVNVPISDILAGRIVVEDAIAEALDIHYVVDEQGQSNLPDFGGDPEQPAADRLPDFLVQQLAADGSLTYEDRVNAIRAEFPAWTLGITGTAQGGDGALHRIDFVIAEAGTLEFETRQLPVNVLALNADLTRDDVLVNSLNLDVPGLQIASSGTSTGFADPALAVDATATANLAPLLAFAGVELDREVSGTFALSLAARNTLGDLQLTANIASDDIVAEPLRQVALDADVEWSATDGIVRLTRGVIAAPEAALEAQATFRGVDAEQTNEASVRITRVNMPRLTQMFDLPVTIASRITGTVNAQWQGVDVEAGTIAAQLRAAATQQEPAPDLLPVTGQVNARVANRRINIQAQGVEALDTVVNAELATTLSADNQLNGPLTGQVSAQIPDVGGLATALNAFQGLEGDEAIDTTASGQIQLLADIGGTIENPTATAQLEGSGIRYAQIEDASITANANYDGTTLEVANALIAWMGSEIRADATIGLEPVVPQGVAQEGGEQPAGERPLRFNASTTDLDIPTLLSTFGYDYPVAGRVSLTAQGDGTIEQPNITANLLGHDLAAYGAALGELTLDAAVANRTVQIESLQLDRPAFDDGTEGGTLTASGSFNLDTQMFTADVDGNELVFRNLDLGTNTDPLPVRGIVNLTASANGTANEAMDALQVDLNLTARDAEVQGTALGDVTVAGTINGSDAEVTAEVPLYNLRAEATGSTVAPYPVNARVSTDNLNLADLPWSSFGSAEAPVQGSLTATIDAVGDAENWQDGMATVAVSALTLETPVGQVQNSQPLEIAYQGRIVDVRSLQLSGAGSSFSVTGQMPLDATAAPGSLRYQGQSDIAAFTATAIEASPVEAAGQLAFSGELRGSLERFEPVGQITLTDGSVVSASLKSPLEQLQLDLELADGQLEIQELSAVLGTGSVSGQGSIPLALFPLPEQLDIRAQTQPAQLSLDLTGLSLESLSDLPEQVAGGISLHLEAEAPRPELDAVTATLTFNELNLTVSGVEIAAVEPPVITLANNVAEVQQFTLRGPVSELTLSGSTNITDQVLRDVRIDGQLNAALLGGFTDAVTTAGLLRMEVSAEGQLTSPELNGFVEMEDGRLAVTDPRLDMVGINLRANLTGQGVELERFEADANGGTVTMAGTVGLAGAITPNLEIAAREVYLDFPEGLRTLSDLDLSLASTADGSMLLSGTVNVEDGSYTEILDLQRALSGYLASEGGVQLVEARNEQLSQLTFDVAVETRNPVIMDNNLGELAFTADLNLLGNFYRPALTGRVDIEEDGTLRLQENDYVIERGSITFVNEARIEPLLDIVANTQVRGDNISVNIATDATGDLTTTFNSDNPDHTQADIIALLLTGKTSDELEGRELNAAGERAALSLVAGTVTGRLSQSLQSGLGVSRVRIEPNLISQESDPTARLTIGQDITRFLELIYSMNLTNSSDQIWSTNYALTPRINIRATKQSDNTYRFDFQHDLRFGNGRPAEAEQADSQTPSQRQQQSVNAVSFMGDLQLEEERLRDRFGIKAGDRYDFFKVRKGLDKLEDLYRDQDYLEARLRLRRSQPGQEQGQDDANSVNLDIEANAGPQVEFVYEGWTPPGGLRDRVRQEWERGVFDTQRSDLALDAIRDQLNQDGYLRPELETEIMLRAADQKRVLFTIGLGQRYSGAQLVFEGAEGIQPDELRDRLKRANLEDQYGSAPDEVRDFLTSYYQQQGYLDAEVTGPDYEFNEEDRSARIVIGIDEGPRYAWGILYIEGAQTFSDDEIQDLSQIEQGVFYTPGIAQESHDLVEEEYWRRGYRDVRIEYTLARDPSAGVVDVLVSIVEGPQSVVQSIQVAGTNRTGDGFVRGQIEFAPGDVLDYTKTVDSRRNLYNTGAYSSVEIRTTPVANPDIADRIKQVDLLASVQERTPFRLRYGGFYDTDRGVGFIADFRNLNSLGGGRVIGARTRYDNDVRELRGFFSQPLLRSLPLRTDAAMFVRREFQRNQEDPSVLPFIIDRTGASVQEGLQLQNGFFLTFGYRFERVHTFDTDPDSFFPFDETLRVAPLTSSLTRDTRDELLDATQGSFTSHSFELATARLGSSLTFWRYFGQYFHYLPLTEPRPVPFGGGLEKPRVIYAGGIRTGLARGLGGQSVVRSERFFTGGGTTIRGFEQNAVGDLDVLGRANGGEAMLVINNELRFPLISIFDAVGFLDLGNVYRRLEDFSLTDLRKTGGVGLRVRTPYLLLRLDYGRKLDRRPGESGGEFFFSIGQAF